MQRDYDKLAAKLDAAAITPKHGNGAALDETFEPTLVLRRASDVKMEPITWLWRGWLACGKLQVLAGVPGLGKTTLALSLAATVTRGALWPDGTRCEKPGNVLMWSGEDDVEDTLAPRLAAMGADLARMFFVEAVTEIREDMTPGVRGFDPARDMPLLIEKAAEVGDVRLLVIDPVSLSVAGDSNKNSEVRRGLAPLGTFAQQIGATVIGISHFSKGTAGKEPLDRVTGSLAFGAAPRLVLGAAKMSEKAEDGEQHEDRHVLVRIKSNIGPPGGGFEYAFDTADLPGGISASRIAWGNAIQGSARDILAEAEQTDVDVEERSAIDEAMDFLRQELAAGPVPSRVVQAAARDAGVSPITLRRAKAGLGVAVSKSGLKEGWSWSLKVIKHTEDAQQKDMSIFGGNDHLRGSAPPKMIKEAEDAHVSESGRPDHLPDREAF